MFRLLKPRKKEDPPAPVEHWFEVEIDRAVRQQGKVIVTAPTREAAAEFVRQSLTNRLHPLEYELRLTEVLETEVVARKVWKVEGKQ